MASAKPTDKSKHYMREEWAVDRETWTIANIGERDIEGHSIRQFILGSPSALL